MRAEPEAAEPARLAQPAAVPAFSLPARTRALYPEPAGLPVAKARRPEAPEPVGMPQAARAPPAAEASPPGDFPAVAESARPARSAVAAAESRADDLRPSFPHRTERHLRIPFPRARPQAPQAIHRQPAPHATGLPIRPLIAPEVPGAGDVPQFPKTRAALPPPPPNRSAKRTASTQPRCPRRSSAGAGRPCPRQLSWSGSPSRQCRVHEACR